MMYHGGRRISSKVYDMSMASGKAFTRIIAFLTLNLVRTRQTTVLVRLLLNHVRLFILARLRYWGNRNFYSEIRLWNNIFGLISADRRWIEQYRLEYPDDLDEFIGLLNARFRIDKPKVLDVGSGPISRLAKGIHKFELYCLDPLAREYDRLHRIIGMKVDFEFVEGNCEELDTIFRAESFHLVYASNSLDHTDNPALCIKCMSDMLKPDGVLFVESHEKEGSHHHWYGLHQYDLMLESPNLCLGTKNGTIQNITKNLPLKQIFFRRKTGERYFTVAWQKTASEAIK